MTPGGSKINPSDISNCATCGRAMLGKGIYDVQVEIEGEYLCELELCYVCQSKYENNHQELIDFLKREGIIT